MEKAIYGMAMPFNDYYSKEESSKTYTFGRAEIDSIIFDGAVGATLEHDFSRGLGDTRKNLFLYINEKGVYFKLIPNSPIGLDTYNKVDRGELRQCSVSFVIQEKTRDYAAELIAMKVANAINSDGVFEFYKYQKILLYELCLTNTPVNKSTFCTTDINHELLEGIDWDDPTAVVSDHFDDSNPHPISDELFNKVQEIKREIAEQY